MKRALSFAVAAGLIAAGPAFAQTLGAPPHALGSPAPAPASSQVAAAHATAATAATAATGDNPGASNATRALNLLEARGYPDFSDFTANGNIFRATVVNGGRSSQVSINPQTGAITGL